MNFYRIDEEMLYYLSQCNVQWVDKPIRLIDFFLSYVVSQNARMCVHVCICRKMSAHAWVPFRLNILLRKCWDSWLVCTNRLWKTSNMMFSWTSCPVMAVPSYRGTHAYKHVCIHEHICAFLHLYRQAYVCVITEYLLSVSRSWFLARRQLHQETWWYMILNWVEAFAELCMLWAIVYVLHSVLINSMLNFSKKCWDQCEEQERVHISLNILNYLDNALEFLIWNWSMELVRGVVMKIILVLGSQATETIASLMLMSYMWWN